MVHGQYLLQMLEVVTAAGYVATCDNDCINKPSYLKVVVGLSGLQDLLDFLQGSYQGTVYWTVSPEDADVCVKVFELVPVVECQTPR